MKLIHSSGSLIVAVGSVGESMLIRVDNWDSSGFLDRVTLNNWH